jgi:hypothetical protein
MMMILMKRNIVMIKESYIVEMIARVVVVNKMCLGQMGMALVTIRNPIVLLPAGLVQDVISRFSIGRNST